MNTLTRLTRFCHILNVVSYKNGQKYVGWRIGNGANDVIVFTVFFSNKRVFSPLNVNQDANNYNCISHFVNLEYCTCDLFYKDKY